jgi:hypothetical protein
MQTGIELATIHGTKKVKKQEKDREGEKWPEAGE